jgi:hypothetical protein
LRPVSKLGLALLLASPLASHALHMCTDAAGKASFQDKPCATRDAAPQFAPLKAPAVTEANAQDAIRRLSGAMNARDVVAAQRLLARGFESRILMPRSNQPALLNRAQFGEYMSRVLLAVQAYQVQRSCRHDAAADTGTALTFRCSYSGRVDVLNRSHASQGEELVRVGVEDGEVKLVELSEPKAVEALRAANDGRAER